LDGAIAAYRDAIRINPENADYHCNLGGAILGNGDIAAATSSYETFLRLNPNHPIAASIQRLIAELA
jgi:cytochrome c-type biogenesis protein CcmH/NrfG